MYAGMLCKFSPEGYVGLKQESVSSLVHLMSRDSASEKAIRKPLAEHHWLKAQLCQSTCMLVDVMTEPYASVA
jgi:hypothetical protein